jgi:hypothetical protein
MTNTTPFIYEREDLKIKEILNSFKKPSLLGINCLYKLDNNKFTNIKYFPTLNYLYLNLSNNNTSTLSNNTTLDGSFLSKSSKNTEDKLLNSNTIFFKENIKEIYNMPNFIEQIRKIDSEIEELELNDISDDSYFSLIWTPVKSFSNKAFNCVEFENMNSISFEVFYKFKTGIYNGHYMNVFGIKEKNIKGNNNIPELNFRFYQLFWFSNKSIVPIPFVNNYNFILFQQQNMIFNQNLFCFLKNNVNNNFFID